MEKSVYQRYLTKEVLQRIVLFARLFNIKIDAMNLSGKRKDSTLIPLISEGKEIGFVKEQPNSSIYPFALDSAIGRIEGYINCNNTTVNYRFNYNDSNFIQGVHTLERNGKIGSYLPGSILEFYKNSTPIYRLKSDSLHFSLENLSGVEKILIGEGLDKSISIKHFNGPTCSKIIQYFSLFENSRMSSSIRYELPKYSGFMLLEDFYVTNDFGQRPSLNYIDITEIVKLITQGDPSFLTFEQTMRELMTISGISLYDSIIRATFPFKCGGEITKGITGVSCPEDTSSDSPLILRLNKETDCQRRKANYKRRKAR
jgi:hypothetical protein